MASTRESAAKEAARDPATPVVASPTEATQVPGEASSSAKLNNEQSKLLADNIDVLRQLQSGVSGARARVLDQVCVSLASLGDIEVPPVPGSSADQTRAEREAAKTAAREAVSSNRPEVSRS